MDGIVLVNKPKGMTSHDVCNKLRRIFNTKKVGHTGTLDPDASGLLVVCVNKATKLVKYLTEHDKEYYAEVTLGFSTTTEDSSGEIIDTKHINTLDKESVDEVLKSFIGDYTQIPPMYSAIKYQGKKLYEYARKGIIIEDRPKRELIVYNIKRTSDILCSNDTCKFNYFVKSSKGLYVRTLSYDIGQKLLYPAHMSSLTRNKVGDFKLENAFTIEEIREGNYKLVSIKDALSYMAKVIVDEDIKKKISYGALLEPSIFNGLNEALVVDKENTPLAVYKKHPTKNLMKIDSMF